MKNTAKTRHIIKEWLGWCCQPDVVCDEPQIKENFDGFHEHRHDQSILNNLKVLHNLTSNDAIRQYIACNVGHVDPGKVDLMDVTWIIPVKYDHPDRQANFDLVLDWLQKHFNTNIIVGEQGSDHYFEYVERRGVKYMYFDYECFHRTRMLNQMTMAATTNIIVNHDADIILPINAVTESVQWLRQGNPFVYPYSGAFLRVSRSYHELIRELLQVEPIMGVQFKGWTDGSVGGSVAFLRDKYAEIGMENENYFSHAPEDTDRAKRFTLFGGYKRTEFPLFHLDHFIGPDSHHGHDYHAFNEGERRRIKAITTPEKMMAYIKTWPWYVACLTALKTRK